MVDHMELITHTSWFIWQYRKDTEPALVLFFGTLILLYHKQSRSGSDLEMIEYQRGVDSSYKSDTQL